MSKQQDIHNYINTIVGATVTTSSLCIACKCTLPTVLTYIKNNPNRFEKVSRGSYRILAATMTNTTNTPAPQIGVPQHDW